MTDTPKRHPFLEDLADDVTLTSSVLRRPVAGRDAVLRIVKAGGSLYLRQSPTFLQDIGDRRFFEYAFALAEVPDARGLVAMVRGEDGAITDLHIAFSPLGAVEVIAASLRDRLSSELGAETFL